MHMLLAVGVTILSATTPTSNSQPSLSQTTPLSITFVASSESGAPSFEDAITSIARIAGVVIELDVSMPQELRRQAVADGTISLNGAGLEDAIGFLTRMKGLSYSVVNARTLRIFKKV